MKRCVLFLVLGSMLVVGCSCCSGQNSGSTDDATETAETSSHPTETVSSSGTTEDTTVASESTSETGGTTPAQPWTWEDLPQGENCGIGCRQVSFSEQVRSEEWDVSDDFLVYNGTGAMDKMGPQEHLIHVVDWRNQKYLSIPNLHESIPSPHFATFNTTIYEGNVYYVWREWGDNPDRSYTDIAVANIVDKKQEVFRTLTGIDTQAGFIKIAELDASSSGLVAKGGCGDPSKYSLCYFPLSGPRTPRVLVDGNYGSHNTIIGDSILYYTGDYDIHLYNVATSTVNKITDDQYTPSQLMARMHNNRVVYQDLRFGEGDGMGNWNHAAVFLYDLETKQTLQITTGEWIACNPDIQGDLVVWLDYRDAPNPNDKSSNRGADIWGYNLATKATAQITHFSNRSKILPRIWGDKVFVHMMREDTNYDSIYMFDVPQELK